MSALQLWVQSPFVTKNDKLHRLIDYLSLYHPAFSSKKFNLVYTKKYVYNDTGIKDKTILRLISELNGIAQSFIAYTAEKKEPFREKWQVLRYYGDNNLPNHFESLLKKMDEDVGKVTSKSSSHFYNDYLLALEKSTFLSEKEDYRIGDINFQSLTDTFDIYWVSKKLEQLCQMLNRGRSVKHDYKLTWKEILKDALPKLNFLESDRIRVWFYALELLDGAYEKDKFVVLRNMMLGNVSYLGIKEKRIIFTYLENLAVDVFHDKQEYYHELYALYNYQAKTRIFYSGEYLIPNIFTNYVTVCLAIGSTNEAFTFIRAYAGDLMPEYEGKEDTINYNKARVAFAQKKFEECLDFLNLMVCHNIYTKMGERRMRMKLYFEMEYWELFENLINSFRKFLVVSKETVAEHHLQANRNFINYTNRIYHLKFDLESHNQKLEQEMVELKILPERKWLMEKLKAVYKS